MNFPSSPVNGQTFSSGGGGPTYRYDSAAGVWNIDKTGGSGNVFISDTKPANPFPGMRWYRSTDMREFIYYVDTDSAQWIETSQSDSQRPASDSNDYAMNNGSWSNVSSKYARKTQLAAGVGQMITLYAASGVALVLPAGGTWKWAAFGYAASGTNIAASTVAGVDPGGTTIRAAGAGTVWTGWAERID